MLRLLKFLLSIPVSILLIYWVLANMQPADWVFSPVHDSITLPIGYLLFGFFIFGFLSGVFILWLNALPGIFEKWRLAKETKKQQKRLDMLENEAVMPSPKDNNQYLTKS